MKCDKKPQRYAEDNRAAFNCTQLKPKSVAIMKDCARDITGLTENDGHENDGPSKLQGMKLQDMKMTDQIAGHEIAGHENAGHENARHHELFQ